MVTPAVVVSNTCSYSPAYRLTSVDVPGILGKQGEIKMNLTYSSYKLLFAIKNYRGKGMTVFP